MEQQEKIERYLRGIMSVSERRAFEQAIKADSELAGAVAQQRELSQFFEDYEPELEEELTRLGNKYFVEKSSEPILSKWWLALLLILVFILIYKVMNWNKSDMSAPDQKEKQQIEKRLEENIRSEKPSIILPEDVDSSRISPSPSSLTPIANKENTSSPPIAKLNQNNFDPNPVLESLLREGVRSEERIINVISPTPDTIFRHDESIPLVVSGTTNDLPPYELLIYSNRVFDFDNDYRLLEQSLSGVLTQDDLYRFYFKAQVPFEQGMYYLIIRTQATEEMLYISSFKVH